MFLICINCNICVAEDYSDIMPYLTACSSIKSYDGESIDNLMLDILNSCESFVYFSDTDLKPTRSDKLKMCNSDYIKDIAYKVFRISAPTPPPAMLTELGYCESNGFYYFAEVQTPAEKAEIKEIIKVIPLDDDKIYTVFSNTTSTAENETTLQYSGIELSKDELGYYVTSIEMGTDFSKLSSLLKQENPTVISGFFESVRRFLPLIIIIISLTAIGFVLNNFILK